MPRRFQFSLGALLGGTALVAVACWEWGTFNTFGLMPDRPHLAVRAVIRVTLLVSGVIFVVCAYRGSRRAKD